LVEEYSILRFSVANFFATLVHSRPFYPISTLLVKLVLGIINSEPEPDKKHKQRVEWIYNHTHERVNEPLSIIELTVFRNLDKGLNREIEIGDRTFNLAELYVYIDEVILELNHIVIDIAKKYSLDIPMIQSTGTQSQEFKIG